MTNAAIIDNFIAEFELNIPWNIAKKIRKKVLLFNTTPSFLFLITQLLSNFYVLMIEIVDRFIHVERILNIELIKDIRNPMP